MEYKITTLNGRHFGKQWFKYYVTPVVADTWVYDNKWAMERQFMAWQAWCWNTYGQGTERDWHHHIQDTSYWSWQTKNVREPRLYLRGDPELMLFKLKFS